jgi:hypothetical protein
MIVVLSGASAGVASTTFGSSAAAGNAVAEAWAVAGAVTAAPVSAVVAAGTGTIPLAAGAGAAVLGAAVLGAAVLGAAVFGDEVFADTEAAGEGVGAAAFAAGGIAGWLCGVVREDARAEISGLPLGGATTAEAGGGEDGTAAARTLVTIARAATGVFSGSLGRSTRESTTPAPAVAPIAVATRTTRAVRAKLGAGAK